MRGQFAELQFIKRLGFVKTFLHVISQYEISPKVLLPYTWQLLKMMLRIGDMTAYGISYHTIDPQGEPVIASGVVYVPRKKGKPKGVIEVSPLTRSKIDCATRDIMAAEMDELGRMGQHEGVFDITGRQISVSEADLRGRNLLERGLYIINGQKVVIK